VRNDGLGHPRRGWVVVPLFAEILGKTLGHGQSYTGGDIVAQWR
jgi:hypothetical protein